MHVVHVGKYYPPEYLGGLESVVVGINDELVKRGVEVTAVVSAVRGRGGVDFHRGVKVVRAGTLGTVWSQPLSPSLASAVRHAEGDVLHLHHPNPLGDLAVLGDRRPVVVTHHSDIVRQRVLAAGYHPLLRRAFIKAGVIVVGSQQLLDSSSELRGFEAKARVIPFGIDPARFALTEAVEARAAELRDAWRGDPVVLAVGRLVGYKGFDVLLRAAQGLDATVVLVGTGREEARLRAMAGPRVVFAGRLADDDLAAAYHAADIFCLPSVTSAEAFGMVLLEAMACGLPLVTTSLPTGVSAVNRDGVTGLVVPPGDAAALREALAALLNDRARRAALGEMARAVMHAEYSAELMGERYLKVYREVGG